MFRKLARWAGRLVPLAVLLLWLGFLRPVSLGGGTSYVIVTGGSMEPTYQAGDLVISQRGAGVEVGDIVVYRLPAAVGLGDRQVVHRVVGGDSATGYTLRGDAAQHADPWVVPADHIVGRVEHVIPFGGRVALFLRNPFVLASLAAGLAFALVVLPGPRRREGEAPVPAPTEPVPPAPAPA